MARIIVSEGLSTSYGSGTLIDRRDDFGLVITNWHVVRDSQGDIEVVFPDGFSSKARALKVDPDWDLAALVIWRPNSTPVKIAATAPRPGDRLTICGYGQGQYREATGRCTKYYAPRLDFPEHMVELNVEARQGDSGGPIFDDRGELAGVLFGAGEGTTLGSFGGRVHSFLATLAPGIGVSESAPDGVPNPTRIGDVFAAGSMTGADDSQSNSRVQNDAASALRSATTNVEGTMAGARTPVDGSPQNADGWHSNRTADKSVNGPDAPAESYAASRVDWFDHLKSVLAAIGVVAIVVAILRSVR